jgi:membrane fusion protein (multidrug efflux system)
MMAGRAGLIENKRPLVSFVALLLLAACSRADNAEKARALAPEAGYVVLKSEAVPLVIELAGRTSAYETSEVRPQVSGIIRERLFAEGSLEATKTRAERFRPLAEIEAVSRQDYTDAVANARAAEAAVAQNRARLDTATINLRHTNVQAPITGRIGRSIVTIGALVTASQANALTTIQRLDPIFVDIQQSSADLLALRRSLASGTVIPSSAQVRLTLEDGSEYAAAGTLQFAEAMVDPNTGSVTLRARFPNPSGLLLPGMYVRARLSQATAREAILVPQQGVSRDPRGQPTVMLVGPEDKAVQRTIQAERTVGDKWLVTSGLKAGDKVIVEGLGRVKAGEAITPVPAGSRPAPTPQGAALKRP